MEEMWILACCWTINASEQKWPTDHAADENLIKLIQFISLCSVKSQTMPPKVIMLKPLCMRRCKFNPIEIISFTSCSSALLDILSRRGHVFSIQNNYIHVTFSNPFSFSQHNFESKFPKLLSQNRVCFYWVSEWDFQWNTLWDGI